jgi:probable HAF family extracellular repeat protein
MNVKLFSISLLAAGVLLASASPASASGYKFTDLGTLGGSNSFARGINNAGQVVGYGDRVAGPYHAIIWNGTTATDLGTLGGGESQAYAINDAGLVVGYSQTTGNAAVRATLWTNLIASDLGTLDGKNSAAYAINNVGQVGGIAQTSLGFGKPTVWDLGSGRVTDLFVTHPNVMGAVVDINDSGVVVGPYEMTRSPASSSPYGVAPIAINTAGKVVGTGNFGGFIHAAVIGGYHVGPADLNPAHYAGMNAIYTSRTDLGTLPGGYHSVAYALNDSDQVVGWSSTGSSDGTSHATLWNGTAIIDLNSFLDVGKVSTGWVLVYASGINDNGWIVGTAHNNITGVDHAFLLNPCDICSVAQVPEPETYAMFMAGLGLMGFIARRRKNGQA